MKKIILLLPILISLDLFSTNFDNSFITKYEYGKMLYKNPRGISCIVCHGKDAKGKVISTFTHISRIDDKEYKCVVSSNDIRDIPLETFKAILDPKLEKPKRKIDKKNICEKLIYGNIMPTYFLTEEELNSIHYYLTNKE
ncbi:MAG: c-type cytochrome [Campylobacterota bacterium]|nr:c-type cytochrome [Campylobacterota bacterium]